MDPHMKETMLKESDMVRVSLSGQTASVSTKANSRTIGFKVSVSWLNPRLRNE